MKSYGVFTYSKEEGTPAAKLKNQVHFNTKKKRYNKIMELQNNLTKEILEKHIGKTYKVLIEAKTPNNEYYVGRSYMDIPETDGVIFIKNKKKNLEGTFIECEITSKQGYDLIRKINLLNLLYIKIWYDIILL